MGNDGNKQMELNKQINKIPVARIRKWRDSKLATGIGLPTVIMECQARGLFYDVERGTPTCGPQGLSWRQYSKEKTA